MVMLVFAACTGGVNTSCCVIAASDDLAGDHLIRILPVTFQLLFLLQASYRRVHMKGL